MGALKTERRASQKEQHLCPRGTVKLSAVGFEPTRIAPPELESGALDRSAKLTLRVPSDRGRRFPREPAVEIYNSPTGTRTRVLTVRVLYPDQLDYRGRPNQVGERR